MGFFATVWYWTWEFITGLLFLFWYWIGIFLEPFYSLDLLWLVIPVWLSWIASELFQEKDGTSFGNAISNGVVPLWAGLDWTRQLVHTLSSPRVSFSMEFFLKFLICALVFTYGLSIIIEGTKARSFVHYYGRIRDVTYVILIFTPIMYETGYALSWKFIGAAVLFFPVWYFSIEWALGRLPQFRALQEDEKSG